MALQSYLKSIVPMVKNRLILPILAILVFVSVPLYNGIASKYLDESLRQSATAYALARSINAGVSVIQDSSISVSMGVGGDIAVGEVLDPINDATEKLSSIITISMLMIGLEKTLYEISQTGIVYIILIALSLLFIFYNKLIIKKALIILIMLRIFVPFSATVSYAFDQKFFSDKIEQNVVKLEHIEKKAGNKSNAGKADSGFFSSIVESTSEAYKTFKSNMSYYIDNAADIIDNIMNLSMAYFSKYLINLILLPLLLFYLIKGVLKE